MLELRRDGDLALEARRTHVAGQLRREHLEDDQAAEGALRRDEQAAHAAAAELTLHAVGGAEDGLQLIAELGDHVARVRLGCPRVAPAPRVGQTRPAGCSPSASRRYRLSCSK